MTVCLDPARVDQAGDVLSRAFMDDPLQIYVLPDHDERSRLSPPMFRALIRYGLLAGEVWTTPALDGIAVWWPPEHTAIDEGKMAESGFVNLAEEIGAEPFGRFTSVLDAIDPLHRRDMPDPHWYAMVIGVDPARQGRGVGGALLGAVLARADSAGVACYLETTQPRNVAFYRKHGFDVVAEGVEPVSHLRYWTFRRFPR